MGTTITSIIGTILVITGMFYAFNDSSEESNESDPVIEITNDRVVEFSKDKVSFKKDKKLLEKIDIKNHKEKINKKKKRSRNNFLADNLDITNGKIEFEGDNLIQIAQVDSPFINGSRLMATDIRIVKEKNNHLVYVSYNTIGEVAKGAVIIFNVNKKSLDVSVAQAVLFRGSDIHSLNLTDKKLILVGGTVDEGFDSPAFVEAFDLDKGGLITNLSKSLRVDLPSYAATSVVTKNNTAYITVGDLNGGIVEVEKPNSYTSKIYKLSELKSNFYPFEDARYVDIKGNVVAAVKGTDGAVWMKNVNSKSDPKIVDFGGATIPESKSTIEFSDEGLLVALGDGGIKLLDSKNLAVIDELDQLIVDDLPMEKTVSNAASSDKDITFVSDGEAGFRILEFDKKSDLYNEIAYISFGEEESVNSVRYFDNIFVAAVGLGGVKFITYYEDDDDDKKGKGHDNHDDDEDGDDDKKGKGHDKHDDDDDDDYEDDKKDKKKDK